MMMMNPAPQFVPPPQYAAAPSNVPPPPRFPTAGDTAAMPAPRAVRGVAGEEKPKPLRVAITEPPAPTKLTMPSPEQLGISAAARSATAANAVPGTIDWADVHRRLDRLSITCFHLEKLAGEAFRVVCLVPTPQPDRTQRIEATGGSQAEAVQRALLRAEESAAQRR